MSSWENYSRLIAHTERSSSKFQSIVKFLIALLTSTLLSASLHSFASSYGSSQNFIFSKQLETWMDIGVVLSWRITELGLEWFAGFDSYDVTALTILSRGPALDLLVTFFEVSPMALLRSLIIDTLVAYLSFRLVRPLSHYRTISHSRRNSSQVANCDILASTTVQTYIILLATSVYTIILFVAYQTAFPTYLVTYFETVPSVTAAQSPYYITKFPATILVGLAAKTFIFTPAISTLSGKQYIFNAETASIFETFMFNVWGYSTRTKLLIKRTVILMIISGANTFLDTLYFIDGAERTGAAIYAILIVIASGATGTALGLVAAA